jgi:ribulose-phosphate 3-epimerase
LGEIRSAGCKAVVTLKPATAVAEIESALPLVDGVLVMSVNPGYSAQAFMPGSIDKIAAVRARLDALGSAAWLEVDGGVTEELAPQVKAAGVTAVVSASAIFHHPQGTAAGAKAMRAALIGRA